MANEEFNCKNTPISARLSTNVDNIKKLLDKFPDLIMREIKIANNPKHGAVFLHK